MGKEGRDGPQARERGPYPSDGPAGSSSTVVRQAAADLPYLDMKNFDSFPKRIKPLPPDRNESASTCKLFQLEKTVYFRCVKCKKDNIKSDCVAAEPSHSVIMCTRCFSRQIRPKHYKPTRVVPFPSLLSWLNYKPQEAQTTTAEDVTQRAADAVAPSGHRLANNDIGDGARDIRAIAASAMNSAVDENNAADLAAANTTPTVNPCIRVWGRCKHGPMNSMFANAPYNLCIAYLMGLCNGENCSLLHQDVFDLPMKSDPVPPRHVDPNHPDSKKFDEWVLRQKTSRNNALWQLFNNGPLDGLFNQYLPPPRRDEPEAAAAPAPVTSFNIGDITAALKRAGN